MSDASIEALRRCADILAEAKSDENDSYIMGVLAGVEDAIDSALEDIAVWVLLR